MIANKAREQALAYSTVTMLNDLAMNGKKTESGFLITTQKGQELLAKKLVFATGIKDQMPAIKGFAACWGISVIHCPYCHGYEFRNKRTGILANGERAFHIASLVNNLTSDMTILTSGKAEFTEEQIKKLANHQVQIIEKDLSEIEHKNGRITNVVFKDGDKISFNAVYAAIPFVQHSDIPVQLGCELTELGHIKVDGFQKTTIEGVFVCGDNSSMMRSVANAVGTGNLVGAVVNKALTDEQF
ncbi:MAG TPA: NAD(P)/FAD-dependent oxidoreductase [Chitinophagaceae bacterium]|nr:NAD(P)/FAD-dependent oxidoreductase [Chitinophagaceae bacterium]